MPNFKIDPTTGKFVSTAPKTPKALRKALGVVDSTPQAAASPESPADGGSTDEVVTRDYTATDVKAEESVDSPVQVPTISSAPAIDFDELMSIGSALRRVREEMGRYNPNHGPLNPSAKMRWQEIIEASATRIDMLIVGEPVRRAS